MTVALERPLSPEEIAPVVEAPQIHERRFGNQEIQHLPLNSLIMVSQIRGCENPAHGDLKDSIDVEDLDNPINVARVTEEELVAYLRFTNKRWEDKVTLEDVVHLRQPDGLFNLVVGGHSRTLAIIELANEHTEATGQPTDWSIQCKLLKNTSVWGIIAKQLSENIHKGAPIEREAMAIVEMLDIGLENGDWKDAAEFEEAMKGRIKRKTIRAAVNFHRLPDQVRTQVYNRHLPYEAGVSLGKGIDDFVKLERLKAKLPAEGAIDGEADALIQHIVTDKIIRIAGRIFTKDMTSSQARMTVMNGLKQDRAMIDAIIKSEQTGQEVNELYTESLFGEDVLHNPVRILRAERDKARREKMRTLEELATSPLERATQVLLVLSKGEGAEEVNVIKRSTQRSLDMLSRDLDRRTGMTAVAAEVDAIFENDEAFDERLAV